MKGIKGLMSLFKASKDIKNVSTTVDISNITNDIPYKEVSLGYRTVAIFSGEEIERGQVGYSIDKNGLSLTGTRKGDWRDSWIVIGYEDVCGDPIFIDINDPEFPVYTAMHGEGHWDPEIISTSLPNFSICLGYIEKLSRDRKNPIVLEKKPITDEEKESVLSLITQRNKGVSIEFWEGWLED